MIPQVPQQMYADYQPIWPEMPQQMYADYKPFWPGTINSEAPGMWSVAQQRAYVPNHPRIRTRTVNSEALAKMAYDTLLRIGEWPGDAKIERDFDLAEGAFSRRLLFEKKLSMSDVKNRLTVPKTYAEKYFPTVPEKEELHLEFYDKSMRLWKFRYLESSGCLVFSRGWRDFVKAKGLSSNHTLSFYLYESGRGRLLMMDAAEKIAHLPQVKIEEGVQIEEGGNERRVPSLKLFGVVIID